MSSATPDVTALRRSRDAPWVVAMAATTLIVTALPLLWYGRYYYVGDTQNGAFPQWYYYGQQLLAGHWPVLNLWGWRGGNNVAEGQLGLFSPLQMLLSVTAAHATDAVVFSTLAKGLVALVAALGGYLLARSYHLAPCFAFVVGSTIVLGGETQYLDSPSWVTGLLVWALLPWAWWAVRRVMTQAANPFVAFAVCLLITTVGYVYGTIYLALVFLGCLIDAVRLYGRVAFIRVFALGALAGLMAVVVYLPGILTSSVTLRANHGIAYDNLLAVQVSNYAASMIPTGIVPAAVTERTTFPLTYIAWFLPILFWVGSHRVRHALRPMAGAVFVLVTTILWSLGPSVVGPLRFPVRVMPVVVLVSILLTVTLLAKATPRPSRMRLGLSLAVVWFGAWVTASRSVFRAVDHLGAALVVSAGLVGVWLVLRRRSSASRLTGRSISLACVLLVTGSVGVQAYQHAVYPTPYSVDRNTASASDAFSGILSGAAGDVMVVGKPEEHLIHTGPSTEAVIAGSWYLTDARVANTYTTIGFRRFGEVYCMDHLGQTCARSLRVLLSTEPTTGKRRVDLLSVSTLLLWRPTIGKPADGPPPAGWHVARRTANTVMWVRDHPMPTAGGVVATSPGTSVEQLAQSPRQVSFRVRSVPPGGGTVTFSRLAWPGYAVRGGGPLADPVEGYLLTAKVPAESQGLVETVRFTPPGWLIGLACLAASLVLGLLWSLAALVRSRRRRVEPSADGAPPAAGDDPAQVPATAPSLAGSAPL